MTPRMPADPTPQSASATPAETPSAAGQRAVLLELEGVAVSHRPAVFDLLKKHVKQAALPVDEFFFARYAVRPSAGHVAAGVAGPLGLKAAARAALAREIHAGLSDLYTSPAVTPAPGVGPLLQAASAEGMAIGLLSALPEDEATALVASLGLGDVPVRVFCFPAEESFPGADLWLKMAKAFGVTPRGCTVMVSTADGCRSALAAGMRCVAVPDAFTACHDFGGVDLVVEDLAAGKPRALLGLD